MGLGVVVRSDEVVVSGVPCVVLTVDERNGGVV